MPPAVVKAAFLGAESPHRIRHLRVNLASHPPYREGRSLAGRSRYSSVLQVRNVAERVHRFRLTKISGAVGF